MSLEDKIGELTAAVNALTAAMAHPFPTLKGVKPWAGEFLPADIPAPAKAEVVPPKLPTPAPAAGTTAPLTSPAPETTSTPAVGTTAIDYAQVAKAITDTFKVDRAKTVAALSKFGAAKGPQLKPADYAAFLKELTA
jgi:hypothetical protein